MSLVSKAEKSKNQKVLETKPVVLEKYRRSSGMQSRIRLARSTLLISVFCSALACDEGVSIQANCESDPDCRSSSTLDAGTIEKADIGSNSPADSGAMAQDAQVSPDAGSGTTDSGTSMPVDAGFPPPDFVDLTGTYDTHYLLDLSAYLWGLGDLAGPLDTIGQTLSGNISTGVAAIDMAIRDAINQFIPSWVVDVVRVLNNAANLFDEVETDGIMVIKQESVNSGVTMATLTSTESWHTLTVRIIEGCPMGRSDPNYPACARQPIPISSQNMVGPLEVGIRIKDFSGTTAMAYPEAPFDFPAREIEMELTKLLRIAIDVAIRLATNNQVQGLQDALNRAIDCAGLEAEALRIATGVLGMTLANPVATAVRQACDDVKQSVMNSVLGTVEAVGVGWELMVFEQLGMAVDTNANGRPETIQILMTPETISGSFRAIVRDPMGGQWEGINRNP